MIKKIKQFLKLEPQFIYKGIKFYDFESVKNFESILSEAGKQAVKDYFIEQVQIECAAYTPETPEAAQALQDRIDSIQQFGPEISRIFKK